MITLAKIAATPALFQQEVHLRDSSVLLYRPLVVEDVDGLAEFLGSLSPRTRRWWFSEGYDQTAAHTLCDAIGRYDKLRLVAVDPKKSSDRLVALFEFSFGIPSTDITRYAAYGLALDESYDCRFGPCVRDDYHRRGIASALMEPTLQIARRFGKRRIYLWGGVLADNEPAIGFYTAHQFREVGRFRASDGKECIDMLRSLTTL